jgi:DNA-binding SARP family transcriptional activator
MRGLRVLLLGPGRLEFDGQPLTRLMPVKQQALVFFLATADAPVPRARLAPLLWGDAEEPAARASLRAALARWTSTTGRSGSPPTSRSQWTGRN